MTNLSVHSLRGNDTLKHLFEKYWKRNQIYTFCKKTELDLRNPDARDRSELRG